MQLDCPHCGASIDEMSGIKQAYPCPTCGQEISFPSLDETIIPGSDLGNGISQERIPERLGRYRITEVIGTGSFGTVLRGHDDELRREVAIKIPHRNRIRSPVDIEMFLAEAKVVAGLDHPGIVPVFDVGHTDDGRCYIVMKFIEGSTLADLIRKGRMTHRKAAEIVTHVAQTLHHAHQRGLVHRDIKPANILIDDQKNYYVADFGLALKEDDFSTGPTLVGTPSYMSPEQANGEGHRVDARTDVFSLGVVFYEMLTGRKPFRARETNKLLTQIATQEPRPPRQIDDSIPRELDRICLKAMSKRLADRYSTAVDFADDVLHWLQPDSVSVTGSQTAATDSASRMQPASNLGISQSSESSGIDESTSDSPPLPGSDSGSSDSSTLGSSESGLGIVKIVPKGLRSFDAQDANFFLELLPGPRDRDGLPESIRFWRTRLSETDADRTFAIGLMYGPSGCGKSSLVKAGLLPRLPPHIVSVYLEATPNNTETRLLNGLRRACPGLPPGLNLVDSMAALRRGEGLSAQRKLVLVLDQFEQWLHAKPGEKDTVLAQALQQCDGTRLQCVLMVRDDFWMSVTRFMHDLEVRLVEGENSAAVDLFSPRHSRKVLANFGRAYGSLPQDNDKLPADQEEFLKQAVEGLSQDGQIIPVRLALFADMIKKKPWTLATFEEVGGIEGIGVTFFEETFNSSTAPPEHRLHLRAIRRVLTALQFLPGQAANLKGHLRSRSELLELSGYARRPKEFDDLMHILDSQLRIVTPTDPDGDVFTNEKPQTNGSESEQYYQLTHDYLVPPLREWLTRKQRESIRGRAELRLSERAAIWNSRPQKSHLPSSWEWANIRLFTKKRNWTKSQKKMMRAAAGMNALRFVMLLVLLVGVGFGTIEVRGHLKADLLCEQLLYIETPNVSTIILQMEPFRRWTDPRLKDTLLAARYDSRERLNASLALVRDDPSHVEYLYGRALRVDADEFPVIRDALFQYQDKLVDRLWKILGNPQGDVAKKTRAALMLASYDPPTTNDAETRWREYDTFLANRLLEIAVKDTAHFEDLLDSLGHVGPQLLSAVQSLYRDSDKSDAERAICMNIAEKYGAGNAKVLADILMVSGNVERFEKYIPAIQDNKAGRRVAVFYLKEQLGKQADEEIHPEWNDQPLDPAWSTAPQEFVKKIEAGQGLLTERFAFCQTMPFDEFGDVAEGLRESGYRPTLVRPFRVKEQIVVAAAWTRDLLEWRLESNLTSEETQQRNDEWMDEQFFPVGLSAYNQGDELRFILLSAADPDVTDSRLSIAVTSSDITPIFVDMNKQKLRLLGQHVVRDAADEMKICLVWLQTEKTTRNTLYSYGSPRSQFEESLDSGGLPLWDVVLYASTSKNSVEQRRQILERYIQKLESNPNDEDALLGRGIYHYALQNDQEALADLSAFLEKSPTNVTGHDFRALVNARLGRDDEARADVVRYLQYNSQTTNLVGGLTLEAVVATYAGDADDVLKKLEEGIADHSDDPEFLYLAGNGYAMCAAAAESKQPELAARYAQRAVELLEQAFESGFSQYFRLDRFGWDSLQEHPKFQEIKNRGNLDHRYTSLTKTNDRMNVEQSHGLTPVEHLKRCRQLADQGYRLISISAAMLRQTDRMMSASVWERPLISEDLKDEFASQQSNASMVLLKLDDIEPVWKQLKASHDPRQRSFLIHRFSQFGIKVERLIERLDVENDVSIRRALIQSLGEYSEEQLPRGRRKPVVNRLLHAFQNDPDPGLHSSAEWLLRQWGQAEELAQARDAIAQAASSPDQKWFNTSQGHTLALVEGPLQFKMGSPTHEAGKSYNEYLHNRKINRTYAIATQPVTVAQFQRFLKENPDIKHTYNQRYSPEQDCPITSVNWYDAVRYCRWLSEKEGIQEQEMCYPPLAKIKDGFFRRHKHLQRGGYRLPTDAEWEYACRAGASTRFHFGDSEQLMGKYAWTRSNSENHSRPVGQLKPNGFGLFDLHGNVREWCDNVYVRDLTETRKPVFDDVSEDSRIADTSELVLRNSGFNDSEIHGRSADRGHYQANSRYYSTGFRIARTLPKFEIVPQRQTGWQAAHFRLKGDGEPFAIRNLKGDVKVSPMSGYLPATVTVTADDDTTRFFEFAVEQTSSGEIHQAQGILAAGSNWEVKYFKWDKQKALSPEYRREIYSAKPLATATYPHLDLYWDTEESPAESVPDDYFATLASARLSVPAGIYDIHIESNNGVRVLIDSKLVIDKWLTSTAVEDTVRIQLKEGEHAVRIEHYESSGWGSLKFEMWPVERKED